MCDETFNGEKTIKQRKEKNNKKTPNNIKAFKCIYIYYIHIYIYNYYNDYGYLANNF